MSDYLYRTNPLDPEVCRAIVGSPRWRVTFTPDGCHVWAGYKTPRGYGTIGIARPSRWSAAVHRVAWVAAKRADVTPGMVIDHLCRNRACVNPEHLEMVLQKENILRGESVSAQHARKTHCANGHAFNERNTYFHKGVRHCRPCNAAAQRRRKDRRLKQRSDA